MIALRGNNLTRAARILDTRHKTLDESGKSGQVERMRGVICPAFLSTILEKNRPETQNPPRRAGF